MNSVQVRPATRADVKALSVTLGRAFFDDPVMRWMLPDADLRRRKLHRLFAAMTRHHYLARGGTEVAAAHATAIGGAALWDPPGDGRPRVRGTADDARPVPGFRSSLQRGVAAEELMKKAHPEEPHWYLAIIGSDPDVRGQASARR